jgi:hypothetical protein
MSPRQGVHRLSPGIRLATLSHLLRCLHRRPEARSGALSFVPPTLCSCLKPSLCPVVGPLGPPAIPFSLGFRFLPIRAIN